METKQRISPSSKERCAVFFCFLRNARQTCYELAIFVAIVWMSHKERISVMMVGRIRAISFVVFDAFSWRHTWRWTHLPTKKDAYSAITALMAQIPRKRDWLFIEESPPLHHGSEKIEKPWTSKKARLSFPKALLTEAG